jgi:diaminobutyrate-2-oxoglutarate transaminase
MHTPNEEQGLRARRLQSRVVEAFHRLPPGGGRALLDALHDRALKIGLSYVREDDHGGTVVEAVRVMPLPVVITPEQRAYVHATSLQLLSSLKRLPRLYRDDPDVRTILQLPTAEEVWFLDTPPGLKKHDPYFARLDAIVDYASPRWQDTLRFVEPNLSGVGGLHLLPMAERLAHEEIFPRLAAASSSPLTFETCTDIRELLVQELIDQAAASGRSGRHIVLIEPRETTPGVEEQDLIARHFEDRYGVTVGHADPRELTIEGGEVCHRGRVVDVAYRDYAVADLLALEAEGVDLTPMRRLFAENRMVSSITAELDQKAQFEVFTDPTLLERHFGPDEIDVLGRHIPWTRLVFPRVTSGPDGRDVELLALLRDGRADLVLKPNRSYGGFGVVVGAAVDDAAWQVAVDTAIAAPRAFVVQQRADLPVIDVPVDDGEGGLAMEPFYVVMGFAPSRYGLAILGRASQKQVVNVAQRGGIVPVVVAHGARR